MKRVVLALLALLVTAADASCAAAQTVPLPRPRPPDLHAPEPAAPETPQEPARDEACLERLKAAGMAFDQAAPPAAANAACVIDTAVRLTAVGIATRPGAVVRLPDQPILACRFAERLGGFIGDLAAPLVAGRLAVELTAVRTGPGYECRNRNRVVTGHLSAHALGLAVDVEAFELANGKVLPVKPDGDERGQAVVAAIRTAACGWFTTVLGPGSDPAHAEHMHVDIQTHGSGERYRICQ